MEKQLNLVSYEQAQRLKKAGFDWETTHYYIKDDENKQCFAFWEHMNISGKSFRDFNHRDFRGGFISAQTVALALKWFRNEKGIRGFVLQANRANYKIFADYDNGVNSGNYNLGYNFYNTYEAAESALLDELLNILEKN